MRGTGLRLNEIEIRLLRLLFPVRPNMDTLGRCGKMFSKVEGKVWVDKSDFGWIKENQRSFCSGPHLVDENLRYVLSQSPLVLAI